MKADEFTELFSRRSFISLSQHAFTLCKRHNNKASLIYIDLEGQAWLDGESGKASGSRTLAAFARLLYGNFRESDVVGRLGAGEFAVFLTNADKELAAISLRRFAGTVAAYNESDSGQLPLTYSAGIENVDFDYHHSIDDLLAHSNTKLYRYRKATRKKRDSLEET